MFSLSIPRLRHGILTLISWWNSKWWNLFDTLKLRGKTQKWVCCVILTRQGLSFNFKNCHPTLFCQIFDKSTWYLIVSLHKGDMASGTGSAAAGVVTRVPLSAPLKWALTSTNPAAQCCYELTLHALFIQAAQAQWPIIAAILFTSVSFLLPVFRSGRPW